MWMLGGSEVLHLTRLFNKRHGREHGFGGSQLAVRQIPQLATDGDTVGHCVSHTVGKAACVVMLVVAATSVAGCGMGSLTSGIGGGMFGGSASKGSDQPLTKEKMLTAAKSDGAMSVGGDLAGGCPRFQIWPRDHHVTIYESGRAGDGLGVIHRGEITQTARECQIDGTRVTVKYGFSGRVLLGPRGKSGSVTLPVNIFVTDAKRERIQNDQATVDVVISSDKPIGYFSAVRTITFNVPEGARAGEFEVFVGFDQKAPGAG